MILDETSWKTLLKSSLLDAIQNAQRLMHGQSNSKGFWPSIPMSNDEQEIYLTLAKLALIGEEVGEAVSAVRKNLIREEDAEAGQDTLEVELADILIRCFDLAHWHRIDLMRAVMRKMAKNSSRPYRHGKNS